MKKILLFIGLTFLLCACEEHDLGVSKEVLYQKTFEQEFGQIAPGHQWGFDVAEAAFQFQNNITRAIIKADMNVEGTNLRPWQIFGKAPDITQKEHDEVLAWFTNHKVNWTNTPTHFEGYDQSSEVGTVYSVDPTTTLVPSSLTDVTKLKFVPSLTNILPDAADLRTSAAIA